MAYYKMQISDEIGQKAVAQFQKKIMGIWAENGELGGRMNAGEWSAVTQFVKSISAASNATAASEPATAAQINYLTRLIADDIGAATTIGAHTRADLTKAQASRFISLLKSGV